MKSVIGIRTSRTWHLLQQIVGENTKINQRNRVNLMAKLHIHIELVISFAHSSPQDYLNKLYK